MMLRLAAAGLVVALSYGVSVGPAATYSGGAPVGFAGDFDNVDGSPVVCTACHSGFALNSGEGSVEVDVPESVAPGQTVRITVTVDNQTEPDTAGSRRQGFQAVVVDASTREPLGRTTLVDAGTRFAGFGASDTVYVTHNTAGTSQTAWSFDWTAPAVGLPASVRVYVAANAANGDGEGSGDRVYATSVDVPAAGVATERPASAPAFDLSPPVPNPVVSGEARIEVEVGVPGTVEVALVDGRGRRVRRAALGAMGAGAHRLRLDVRGLAPGTYFVVADGPGGRRTQPLVVAR